ncbi:olfactory receptor 52A5-like [Astyanax mexicanus]|uniref:Olfactory receptor 52A5-like n=1 Tax=Astyanax mexicanus TaxID=7994 RepID=A0A8T2L8W2_ASTMX|nr:olfactory receptor 52A5-like [Astyanax mexicanus]
MDNFQVNISSKTVSTDAPIFVKLMVMQALVGIFLYVNSLMIFTFLKKEVFREDTRYILFAQTLFVDSAIMSRIQMISCIFLCIVVTTLTTCTPLTLVAMCLERYVAICMPLRHASISTSSRIRFFGFFIIWSISSITSVFTFLAYISVVRPGALFSYVVCSIEVMFEKEWHSQARAIILLIFFLMMIVIILFTYIKMMIAARAASSEKKKSTSKGLRTVLLHAVQMILCMVQYLSLYLEMPFWSFDAKVLNNIRYSNFIIFTIVPRCLSPLIYGLRDEKFLFFLFGFHCLLAFLCFKVFLLAVSTY